MVADVNSWRQRDWGWRLLPLRLPVRTNISLFYCTCPRFGGSWRGIFGIAMHREKNGEGAPYVHHLGG